MSKQRWTIVVDVETDEHAGTPTSEDLRERLEEEPGVTVFEIHFEDMIERS